ncbi:SNARE domain [Musa troglodytarum]|uniref:SNARE domain n=1 Tax=Musa troglodytarum TaxID=320322 RepID=A0A9E7K523_9LILI|nr:SNARE domain [Musa troglodytarum]
MNLRRDYQNNRAAQFDSIEEECPIGVGFRVMTSILPVESFLGQLIDPRWAWKRWAVLGVNGVESSRV